MARAKRDSSSDVTDDPEIAEGVVANRDAESKSRHVQEPPAPETPTVIEEDPEAS